MNGIVVAGGLLNDIVVAGGLLNGIVVAGGIDKRTACYAVVNLLLTWIDFNDGNTT